MTKHPRGQASVPTVHRQLGTILKADLAMKPLTRAAPSSFRSFMSPAISVVDVHGGGISIKKSASRSPDVHLLWLQRGSVQLKHEGGCAQLRAGQFMAFCGQQAFEFRHDQRVELLAVYVPGAALERWLPDWQSVEFVPVAGEQVEGRLSFDIARDLLASGSGLQHASDAALVAETVTRLMARSLALVSVSDVAAPADLAEALRRKIRHYCRKQLGSPNLSIDGVVRAMGLSRATLHRLFRGQQHTLMEWVQLERLLACKRLLDERDGATCTLTDIALSQGFKSPAHFSAAFRDRYGMTPRDYRMAARNGFNKNSH